MNILEPMQYVVCLLVGIVVLAEAENKIRRTDVSLAALRAMTWLERAAAIVRAIGWLCLFLVGGGVIFAPGLPREWLEIGFILAALGSACLIVKARLEECQRQRADIPQAVPREAFDRTQALRRP